MINQKLACPSLLFYLSKIISKNIIPDMELNSIANISSDDLKQKGIEALIFDVDNSLSSYNGVSIDAQIEKNFRKLTSEFPSCILSNTPPERRRKLKNYFGIPIIETEFRKPHPKAFLQALDYLQTNPNNTAMIGDRLFTDIVGANEIGIFTIKLNPVKPSSEPFAYRLVRTFENIVYNFYK